MSRLQHLKLKRATQSSASDTSNFGGKSLKDQKECVCVSAMRLNSIDHHVGPIEFFSIFLSLSPNRMVAKSMASRREEAFSLRERGRKKSRRPKASSQYVHIAQSLDLLFFTSFERRRRKKPTTFFGKCFWFSVSCITDSLHNETECIHSESFTANTALHEQHKQFPMFTRHMFSTLVAYLRRRGKTWKKKSAFTFSN